MQFAIDEVVISDVPRFSYRGSMIDSSRHFLDLNTILRHLVREGGREEGGREGGREGMREGMREGGREGGRE